MLHWLQKVTLSDHHWQVTYEKKLWLENPRRPFRLWPEFKHILAKKYTQWYFSLYFTSLSDCYKFTDKQKFSSCVFARLQIIDMEVSILQSIVNINDMKYIEKKSVDLCRIDHNYGKKLAGIPHTLLQRNPSSAKHLSMFLTLIKGS